jgi:hypothetical protein
MLFASSSATYAQLANDSSYNEQLNEYSDEEEEAPYYPPVDPEKISFKKGYDKEQVDVKKFDRKKWKRIIGDEDYSEEQPVTKKVKKQEGDSTYSQSSNGGKRGQNSYDEYEDPEASSPIIISPIIALILKIVFYTLVIAIIGYIPFLIIKNTSLKSKGEILKPNLSDGSTHVEDIKELEIDRLLREATASGNYRLVIRIYFLGLLQKLNEDGFIVWKKDKTNRDYLSELLSKEHYFEEVKSLTIAYELVWYGDHNLSIQTYEQIISSFRTIDQSLNLQGFSEKK